MKILKSPYLKIAFSFMMVILIGTILFLLPISRQKNESINFIDALFQATSATCLTGLTVVSDLHEKFNVFGYIVFILLMQIGGLSFITLTSFLMLIFKKVGFSNKYLLKEALNQSSVKDVLRILKKTVIYSFIIEFIGVIFIMIALGTDKDYSYNFWQLLGYSIFHTVASFNNAGFDIFGPTSLVSFSQKPFFIITTSILITLGGLGFLVMDDIVTKRSFKKFSINTKLVLISTIFILVFFTILFKLSNFSNTWLNSFFMVVTSRTAGFTTLPNMATLNSSEYIILIIVMFIGGSPGSCAGGVKTVTFVVMIITMFSLGTGKKPVVFKRQIANESIIKAFVLTFATFLLIIISYFIISIAEESKGFTFEKIFFEIISAITTTGLTMGITGNLTVISKLILILLMYFGRLGPLTIINLFNKNYNINYDNSYYIEEKVIIG